MSQFKSLLFMLLLIVFAFTGCSQNSTIKDASSIHVKLDKYVAGLAKKGVYGSFLVKKKDSTFFEKSIGFANKSKKRRANAHTVYPFGSITKEYTQSLILQLILENKLSPDDVITQFFSNVPEDKRAITIAQLLNHRSGITEYHDEPFRGKYPGIPADFYPITKPEALQTIFTQPLQFQPDTNEGYSNSGYTLLAFIAEKVTGQSYEDLVVERILQPAGTKTSDFSKSLKWQPTQVAIGYGDRQYGKENSPYYWPRNPMPCYGNGGLAGTLMDLYRGLKFMIDKESKEKDYGKLAKQFRYIKDLPEQFITYGGGNDLGFVAGYFVDKSIDRYFLFALNNNRGDDHAYLLRDLVLMLFDYDFANLVPEHFNEEGNSLDQEVYLSKEQMSGKWGLPDNAEFRKIAALLDVLSGAKEMPINQFLADYCSPKLDKASKEQLAAFPISAAIQFKKISSTGKSMELTLVDDATNKSYQIHLKINTKTNKIESIDIEEL